MNANTVVGLLGSGTLGLVGMAIVNAIIGRRKLGADVTKIATDAAGGVIERLEAENVRLNEDNVLLHEQDDTRRRQIRDLNDKIDRMQRRMDRAEQMNTAYRRAQRETSQLHAAWDALAITKMREGTPPIDIPDAPPLTPPTLPFLSDDDVEV